MQPSVSETTLPEQSSSNSQMLDALLRDKESELIVAINNFCKIGIKPIESKYLGVFQFTKDSLQKIDLEKSSISQLLDAFIISLEDIRQRINSFNDKTVPELASNLDIKNSKFLKTISYIFEKIPYKTTVQHDGKNSKIRLYLICNSFKHKVIDPEIYTCLGMLGNVTHEELSRSIQELIDKTYHLFDLNPFNKDSASMTKIYVKSAIQELLEIVEENEIRLKNLSASINEKLLVACRTYINSSLSFCDINETIPSYKNILEPERISRSEVLWERSKAFPEAWKSNQSQSHNNQITDLSLAAFQVKINKRLNEICRKIQQQINSKIEKQFDLVSKVTGNLKDIIKEDNTLSIVERLKVDDGLFINTNLLLEDFVDDTTKYYEELDSEVELMKPKLIAKFKTLQFGSLSPIQLDIDNIAKHILDTKLYGPLKVSIDKYISEVTDIYDDIGNRINLIKFSLSESIDKKQAGDLEGQLNQLITVDKETYLDAKSNFGEKIRLINKSLHTELNSDFIVHNLDNWNTPFSKYTRKGILKRIRTFVKDKYFNIYRSINATIADRRHDAVVSNFDFHHNLMTDVEYGRAFVRHIELNTVLGRRLPFYYKQLFQGKHIPVQGKYIGRQNLLDSVEERIAIDKDIAILIGGASGSGKTHFARHLASTIGGGKIYKIDACNGAATDRALNSAFAKATNMEGAATDVLKALKRNCIFLIDDIESWWDRTAKADPLSNVLNLVLEYRGKHKFILCSNLYALQALKGQKALQKAINFSISLPPLSKDAIKEILLDRHTVGGLDFVLRGEYNEFNSRSFDNFISNVYSLSKGNIGLAQEIWLQQITDIHQNVVSFDYVKTKNLNNIDNPYWQWILYQMLINDGLTSKIINKLFKTESDFIHSIIDDMVTSGLVVKKGSHDSYIAPIVKPAVEKWLNESGLLN